MLHKPTGQEWVLACDVSNHGDAVPAGWPEGIVPASSCELITAASDEQRLEMLRRVAAGSGHEYSYRRSLAATQLDVELERECATMWRL